MAGLRRRRGDGADGDAPPASGGRGARRTPGAVDEPFDGDALLDRLAGLGEAGLLARSLDRAVDEALPGIDSLSPLTSTLAVDYLQRIKQALKGLSLEAGVYVTMRAYVAHLVVEADPGTFGATDVPVLGTLPAPKRGRPPQDLLTRVVKATRRGFDHIRAVDAEVWDGFVACTVHHIHEQAGGLDAAAGAGYLAPVVVDGLVRFGWVLRQVDIHYRLQPEAASGGDTGSAGGDTAVGGG